METLVCTTCGSDWERKRVRGRKPKQCPSCASIPPEATQSRVLRSDASPVPTPQTGPPDDTGEPVALVGSGSAAPEFIPEPAGPPKRSLDGLPYAKRTSGWCNDYKLGPTAKHERCDGDLGKYKCPCDCHKEAT